MMLMEFLYSFCRIPQSEIGEIVGGIDSSVAIQARNRLQEKLKVDRKLQVKFDKISRKLSDLSRSKTPNIVLSTPCLLQNL